MGTGSLRLCPSGYRIKPLLAKTARFILRGVAHGDWIAAPACGRLMKKAINTAHKFAGCLLIAKTKTPVCKAKLLFFVRITMKQFSSVIQNAFPNVKSVVLNKS